MKQYFMAFFLIISAKAFSQNIGIGTSTPQARLHIKGNADTSQLVIDANATQSNLRPLIRLRNAAGIDLLHIHSDNASNTFIGKDAGRLNAPSGLVLGKFNTFIGAGAGFSNTTGFENTATGYHALYFNTTGTYNIATGNDALYSNSTGYNNTAIGYAALIGNNTGYSNTATGHSALYFNTDGYNNTAHGTSSLYSNTTGYSNTANGDSALYRNTTGYYNTALGYQALYSNTAGHSNTANGYGALYSNTSNSNTADGYKALYYNTGYNNTANGHFALISNTTGNYNTAIGDEADVSVGGLINATVIGYAATVTASDKVRVGNSSVTSIGGQVGWTSFSDGRFKTNVREDIPGIDFIKKLRPVSYTFNITGLNKHFRPDDTTRIKEQHVEKIPANNVSKQEEIRYTGFIAQEVELAAKELGFDFSGVDGPKNNNDTYGLRYAEFVVPMVKAMQEQQVLIETLQKQVEATRTMPLQIGKQQKIIDELTDELHSDKNKISDLIKRIEALEKK
ncbi:MAG: tail fiber domain-containing protein [Ferruginibacter sp.]